MLKMRPLFSLLVNLNTLYTYGAPLAQAQLWRCDTKTLSAPVSVMLVKSVSKKKTACGKNTDTKMLLPGVKATSFISTHRFAVPSKEKLIALLHVLNSFLMYLINTENT